MVSHVGFFLINKKEDMTKSSDIIENFYIIILGRLKL